MKIYKEPTSKHKYVFEFTYDEKVVAYCRSIKAAFGLNSLKFYDKRWRFNNIDIMYLLQNKYPQLGTHCNMYDDIIMHEANKKQEKLRIQQGKKLKDALDSDIKISRIKGELYGFQKATVAWLINNNGRGLVSLDMGLGKSFVSLAYIAHTKKEKTLIVSPVSMKYTWLGEVKKWTNLKAMVINSKSTINLEEYNKYDIFIINFDILQKFCIFFKSVNFDCLIIDESTYIKNPQAKRSKTVKEISEKIESVILLSGSPLLNRVVELYTSLNILDNKTWNDYWTFVKRYCAAYQDRWGLNVSGASNVQELKQKIDSLIIRKKKEEVLNELPNKKFIDIPVKLDNNIQKKYQLLEASFVTYLKEVKKKSKKDIQKTLLAETLVKLNELRMLTSEGKINHTKERIQELIDIGEKVVVFSSFNNPLNTLKKIFDEESVLVIGSVPDTERQIAIEKFQNDSNKKIFFGGMLSANMGITLTAASTVIFIDFDWTPENMRQAYSRIDRIGQKASSISIYQMIALNTIDQKMSSILKKKQRIIDQLIENKSKISNIKENSAVNDIINSFN